MDYLIALLLILPLMAFNQILMIDTAELIMFDAQQQKEPDFHQHKPANIIVLLLLSLLSMLYSCEDTVKPLTLELSVEQEVIALGQLIQIKSITSEKASIQWSIIERPNGSINQIQGLSISEGEIASLIPDVLGRYTISAMATSASQKTAKATMSIDVLCQPPTWQIALASNSNFEGLIGKSTEIRAELSAIKQEDCGEIEPLDAIVNWRLLDKPVASQSNLIPIAQTVQRLDIDQLGTYLVQATVSDALGRSQSVEASIKAECGHHAPTITLNAIPQANIGQAISLSAEVSDEDELCGLDQEISLQWRWKEKPASSMAEFQQTQSLTPWFIADLQGNYVVELEAMDPEGNKSTAQAMIAVNPCGSHAPVINSIDYQPNSLLIGTPIQLFANYMDLDQEEPCVLEGSHRLRWYTKKAPSSSIAMPTPEIGTQPFFTPDAVGLYEIGLEIIDENGHIALGHIDFQVGACGNAAPTVELLLSPNEIAVTDVVRIEAIANDIDEECGLIEEIFLKWRVLSQPTASQVLDLSNELTSMTSFSFTADVVGVYQIEVTPVDQSGRIGQPKIAQINVSNCGRLLPKINAFQVQQHHIAVQSQSDGRGFELLSGIRIDTPLVIYPEIEDPNLACGRMSPPLRYEWTLSAKPLESEVQIDDHQVTFLDLSLDRLGEYQGTLKLINDVGGYTEKTFVINTSACGTASPLIEWTTADQPFFYTQSPIPLSINITDMDRFGDCQMNQDFDLHWSLIALPVGSQSQLPSTQALNHWFIPDLPGQYTVRVSATDPQGNTSMIEKTLNVLSCHQQFPENLSISINQDQNPNLVSNRPISLSAHWDTPIAQPNCITTPPPQFNLSWQIIDRPIGSRIALNDSIGNAPWLIPDVPGVYVVEVALSDATGLITIKESQNIEIVSCGAFKPVVHLESSRQQINSNQLINIEAVASTEIPNCVLDQASDLHYEWQVISSPANAIFTDVSQIKTSMLAWQANTAGHYLISVTVTDAQNRVSLPAVIDMEVLDCGGFAPQIDALQVNGTLLPQNPLQFSAIASDPNALCNLSQPFSYRWRFLKTPSQSNIAFPQNLETLVSPQMILDEPGDYEVELQLTNDLGLVSQKTLGFTIGSCGSQLPVAKIKIDPQTPTLVGQIITLDGSESFDPDALSPCLQDGNLSFHWQLDQVPAAYQAQPSLIGKKPWLYLPIAGTYRVSLRVTDQSQQQSLMTTLTFDAQGCGDQSPVIDEIKLDHQSPQVGENLFLSAIVSDADIQCGGVTQATVSWKLINAPNGINIDIPQGLSTSFIPTVTGLYTIEATAISVDGKQSQNPKQITFEVNACGSFTPMLSLNLKLQENQYFPTTQQRIAIQAQTSDADELGACALTQTRAVAWRLLSQPINSNLQFNIDPTQALPNEKATQSAISFEATMIGTYRFEATVTDQSNLSQSKIIDVNIENCGDIPPEIQSIHLSQGPYQIGQTIDISAEIASLGSSCLNQNILPSSTWQWYLIRPNQSVSTLVGGDQSTQQLIPDRAGTYTISAVLISSNGQISAKKSIEITVVQCGDQIPIIDSLSSIPQNLSQLAIGQTLSFSINGRDPDQDCGQGSRLIPQWKLRAVPIGSQAILNDTTSFTAQITPDVEGEYVIEARLAEDQNPQQLSLSKELRFVVGNCGHLAPKALILSQSPKSIPASNQVSANLYGCEGASFIQLDASASEDPNISCGYRGTLKYTWQVVELSPGLSVSLLGSQSQTLNLSASPMTASQTSTIKVKLTVENQLGLRSEAIANINVLALNLPHTNTINPSFFCGQAQAITLTGNNYYRYQGQLPSVQIGNFEIPATSVSNCTTVIAGELDQCTQLSVTIPAGLSAELYETKVKNPYPLACIDRQPPSAFVLSAPKIDMHMPSPICRGQFNGQITLTGSGFLKVLSPIQQTQITVNQTAAVNTQITQCENSSNFALCTQASFELPVSQKDVANLNIKLANPNPSACLPQDLEVQYLVKQSEPPLINDIIPKKICDQGGSLDLIGDHFEPNMTVALGPYLADRVENTNGEQRVKATWTVQDTPRMQPNLYQITARNQTGCSTTSPILVRVTEGPVPFFVDPPIVYNGITLQATAYLGNLFGGSVSRVQISTSQGNPIDLDFSFDPSKPSQIKLIIPAGLTPGVYGITLFDDVNCPGSTPGLLKVTNKLGLTISSFDPPFAWTQGTTPVTAYADARTPFIPTPRSYLTPSPGNQCTLDQQCAQNQVCRQGRCTNTCNKTDDCLSGLACSAHACVPQAAELKASSLRSVTELQGIISSGFAPGEYDLVTVNPNGDVGLLSKAIKININPPPQIQAVSPGSWKINEPALPVQISGTGFSNVSVKATCLSNGQSTQYALTVISQSSSLIDTRIDTGLLSANVVCSMRVSNADGSYDDFSPLTTVNPSGNFVSFSPEANLPLNAARRLPTVVAAQIPNSSLSLFMIGGDLGSDNTALDDTYTSQIDGFGKLGSWQQLPTRLPTGLTHSQALNIDRFIYVIAGMKSTGQASNQVLRAEILDPLYVPQISEVDFEFDEAIDGLNTGVYYYRITAVYGINDPNNPNGESLASEPQPVFVPNIPIGVRLVLTWTSLADAVGYRIYRSPTPDLLLGQEELIAQVPANVLTFSDEGFSPISQQKPLKQGTLGNWKQVALLNTTRAQHASVVAPDPVNPQQYHVYTFAGLADGVASRGYEHFSVDNTYPRAQVISGVSSFNNVLSVSRTKLNALVATPQEASLLSLGTAPKKAVIYVLGGDNTRTVEVAEVLSNGLLSPWVATSDMSRVRFGYAAGIANNTLLTVCGQNGSASTTAEKGEICGLNCAPSVENISRWSALGNTGALRNCVNPGFASAKGFFYLIGGGDNSNAITNKIDVSLLGGTP